MITNFKIFEERNTHKVGDYYSYKRYLGLPPIIVKLLSIREVQAQIGKKNQYFVELLEEPHTTYVLDSWELGELDEDGLEELKMYLNAEKYNL
jgi:hypothetical protein